MEQLMLVKYTSRMTHLGELLFLTFWVTKDFFSAQKQHLNELEAKYGGREPKAKIIPWMSIKTDVPSQVMQYLTVTQKFTQLLIQI